VIEVLDTDITTLEVDAIANAANTRLVHAGGVAAAIARAGGPAVRSWQWHSRGEAGQIQAGDLGWL